ncbi:hypothetical protein EON65_24145 [archaeon]|nr:MAG: hypothetical protein EON65_24145 [archaeon]
MPWVCSCHINCYYYCGWFIVFELVFYPSFKLDVGFNQALYLATDTLPDSLVVAAGIKTIYSYITIGCAMYSVANFSSLTIGTIAIYISMLCLKGLLQFLFLITPSSADGDDYGYLTVNVSTITCPTGDVVLGASYDQAIAGTRYLNLYSNLVDLPLPLKSTPLLF